MFVLRFSEIRFIHKFTQFQGKYSPFSNMLGKFKEVFDARERFGLRKSRATSTSTISENHKTLFQSILNQP
jgi:hypothetical protein